MNEEIKMISSYGTYGIKNLCISNEGEIKRIGYKSLRGYIQILKRQNKSLKKLGCKVKFDITLPIPD